LGSWGASFFFPSWTRASHVIQRIRTELPKCL
jgi:hypothetical protein